MLSKLIYALSIRLWHLGKVGNWLGNLPWVGERLQPLLFNPEDNQAVIIPVNQAIQGGTHRVLPYTLLPDLINRASHRAILNHCMCRKAEGCTRYPIDLGCLFLGEGAAHIHPTLSRVVDADAALAHMQRALDAGLIPTILHSTLDAFMLQIPFRRMLAVCFCCDCCCTIRKDMRLGPPAVWDTIARLPGLTVEVGPACTGCSACVRQCPVQAIRLVEGQAVIDDVCKGCGRCVTVCPVEAITLRLDSESNVVQDLWALITARTEL